MSEPWTFGQPVPKAILTRHGIKRITTHNRKSYAMKHNRNPCLNMYGNGPEGQTCKGCVHLYATGTRSEKRFLKCKMRGPATGGPGTDHYAGWPACAKYEEAKR